MTRFGAVFWLILVVVAGFATFKAKYAIQDLEDELGKVRKQTAVEQNEIRVLTAEWTYLNQPERLAELNKRFLSLAPVAAQQLQQRVDDIALRAPAPDDLVATNTPQKLPDAVVAPPTASTARAGSSSPPAPAPVAVVAAAQQAVVRTATPNQRSVPTVAAPARPDVHVQLAKAGPKSLDSLIARIAEVR